MWSVTMVVYSCKGEPPCAHCAISPHPGLNNLE